VHGYVNAIVPFDFKIDIMSY